MISFRPPPILPAGTCFPPTVNRLSIQSQLAPRCPQDRQCPQRENSSKQDAMALIPSDNSGTPLRRFSQFRGGGLSPWDSQLPPRRSPPASVGRSPSPSSNCGCPGAPNMSRMPGVGHLQSAFQPHQSSPPFLRTREGRDSCELSCSVGSRTYPQPRGRGTVDLLLGATRQESVQRPLLPQTLPGGGANASPLAVLTRGRRVLPHQRSEMQNSAWRRQVLLTQEGRAKRGAATLVKQEFLIDTFSIAPDIPTNLEITNKVVATPAPSRMGVDVERDGGVRVHRRGGP